MAGPSGGHRKAAEQLTCWRADWIASELATRQMFQGRRINALSMALKAAQPTLQVPRMVCCSIGSPVRLGLCD